MIKNANKSFFISEKIQKHRKCPALRHTHTPHARTCLNRHTHGRGGASDFRFKCRRNIRPSLSRRLSSGPPREGNKDLGWRDDEGWGCIGKSITTLSCGSCRTIGPRVSETSVKLVTKPLTIYSRLLVFRLTDWPNWTGGRWQTLLRQKKRSSWMGFNGRFSWISKQLIKSVKFCQFDRGCVRQESTRCTLIDRRFLQPAGESAFVHRGKKLLLYRPPRRKSSGGTCGRKCRSGGIIIVLDIGRTKLLRRIFSPLFDLPRNVMISWPHSRRVNFTTIIRFFKSNQVVNPRRVVAYYNAVL